MSSQTKVLSAMLFLASPLMACGQSGTAPATAPDAAVAQPRVTFVGNSGFLITAGGRKVLIDSLFSGFLSGAPQADTAKTQFLAALPPFDGVDLILATHNHPDHFSASLVRQYMQNNPKAIFMSTTQATSQLTGLGDRVIAVDPSSGSPVTVEANGIGVEAIYLNHGSSGDASEVFNNGYVVTLGALKLFHTGDVYNLDDARPYNLAELKIDLAFIQHYFFLDDGAKAFMDEVVGGQYLFPIHYQLTTPAFDADTIRHYLPDAIIFSAPMDSWTRP
jgi:L-ascorbate metabolism protein UlaG (beta-lactamase superfamily)